MAVTDQIKVLDKKIKQNEVQYDLDRKAAKISALSSKNLDKYEYLTGEDLALKPSTVEQAKFEYSPLGNIFNKGFKKEDEKEGLFKRLEKIKDKNKELLNAFSAANKFSRAAKNGNNYNYYWRYAFYNFYRDLEKFERMSLGSKHDKMTNFYQLLNSFINTHVAIAVETKDSKDRILSYVKSLCNKYFNAYKKNYDSENLKDEEKRRLDYKQFEIIDNGDQGPKSTKKEETETKRPLWAKINENDFDSLIQDVYNNLDNVEFKTTLKKKTYNLKNAEKFLAKIITHKIGKEEARELYSDLIVLDINQLKQTKGKGKEKRRNILNVLINLESVFTGNFWHCKHEPPKSEESIAERTKLRRQRFNEIANKEKMVNLKFFREYFQCLSPSDMYKKLNKTIGSQENKAQVNTIKDKLANLMEAVKSNPTSNAKKN